MEQPGTLPYVLQILGDAKYGGSTYLAIKWTRFLVEQGCRVDVQTTDLLTIAAMRAIPGVRVITTISIPREVAPGADLRALAALSGLIRRERYTLVQTGMTTAGFVGRLAAWLARAPVIIQDAQGWPVTEYSSLAALLPERRISLMLAGDGPGRLQLERLAADLGLSAQVHFLGFRHDIPALLAATDIFANTSHRASLERCRHGHLTHHPRLQRRTSAGRNDTLLRKCLRASVWTSGL
jgi:glycosyltransferase involved in cell wall biosynthesis